MKEVWLDKANNGAAQERLSQVADHMSGGTGSSSGKGKKGKSALLEKNPDDVSAFRFSAKKKSWHGASAAII